MAAWQQRDGQFDKEEFYEEFSWEAFFDFAPGDVKDGAVKEVFEMYSNSGRTVPASLIDVHGHDEDPRERAFDGQVSSR